MAEVLITMTSGAETEGLRLSPQLVQLLYDGTPPPTAIQRTRDFLRLQLVIAHMFATGSSATQSQHFIHAHVQDIH